MTASKVGGHTLMTALYDSRLRSHTRVAMMVVSVHSTAMMRKVYRKQVGPVQKLPCSPSCSMDHWYMAPASRVAIV